MTLPRGPCPYVLLGLVVLAGWLYLRQRDAQSEARELRRETKALVAEAETAGLEADEATRALAEERVRFERDSATLAARADSLERELGLASARREEAELRLPPLAAGTDTALAALRSEAPPGLRPLVDRAAEAVAEERRASADVHAAFRAEQHTMASLLATARQETETERGLRMAAERSAAKERDSRLKERDARVKAEEQADAWRRAATAGVLPDPFAALPGALRTAVKLGLAAGVYFACDALEDGAGKWCAGGYGAALAASGG